MAKRIQQRAVINGKIKWLSGNSQQELFEAYLQQAIEAGLVTLPNAFTPVLETTPLFRDYLKHFVDTYKSKQSALTVKNRARIIKNHILPQFGNTPIGNIKTADIQVYFDSLCEQGYSRETILKIKNTISPAFDSAVEDELISRNPVKSQRLKINTNKGEHHKALPREKMRLIKKGLLDLDERERKMTALLCYTGMRIEEVLGLKWEDIDFEANEIHIIRAVVHPERNRPLIKDPKSKSSKRTIPIASPLLVALGTPQTEGFILGGEKPLSYQQFKRTFNKIRTQFGIEEYSAHDFRDTCATEWREYGMPIETISRLLGHSNTIVTENCYVKFREKSLQSAKTVMEDIG